jgi:hypothetical protein
MHETSSAGGEVLARLSHLEPLLAGRRVLVLGSPEDAGASAVILSDRGVVLPVAAPDEAGLAPPFDRIVVHPGQDRPLSAERVRALRDLLAPGGLLAVAVPVDDGTTEPLLREAFPAVEAAAVLPLSAWAVVPEGAAPGEVTWDGTRLASQRPTSRLLLCGDRPAAPRGATVLALPHELGPPPVAGEGPDLAAAAAAERAEARAAVAAAEVLALTWRRDELEAELSAAVAERDALRSRREATPGTAATPDLPDLLSP